MAHAQLSGRAAFREEYFSRDQGQYVETVYMQ